MIVPVMAISNLVLTQQIYSEETNGADAHNRDRVLLMIGAPSGKLPTYPSVKSTLTLTSHLGQNVGLGEG